MGLGPKAQKEVLRLDIHGVQATAENVSMQARHINTLRAQSVSADFGYTGYTVCTGYTGYTVCTVYTGYTVCTVYTGYTGYTVCTGYTVYTGYRLHRLRRVQRLHSTGFHILLTPSSPLTASSPFTPFTCSVSA